MSGLLNGAVKLVMLQFIFGSTKALPPGLFQKGRETIEKLTARRSEERGEQFLDPTPDVGIALFPGDLTIVEYKLVDAFYQMRTNARGQEYPVARFTSALEVREEAGEFAKHREEAAKALEMCGKDMWSVVGFLNSFFQDGKKVEGQHTISINFAARNPMVDRNGKPILRWQKDEKGERIGDAPIPLVPKLFLRIEDDDIRVV